MRKYDIEDLGTMLKEQLVNIDAELQDLNAHLDELAESLGSLASVFSRMETHLNNETPGPTS